MHLTSAYEISDIAAANGEMLMDPRAYVSNTWIVLSPSIASLICQPCH